MVSGFAAVRTTPDRITSVAGSRVATGLLAIAAVTMAPSPAHAQRSAAAIGAQAVALVTSVDPAIRGRRLTEGYLTQPTLMGHLAAWNGRVRLDGMLSFEGLTIDRGELQPGMFGEGYVDRRHPHTYVHELVATARDSIASARVSLSIGKGFAPFGTDDPMSRPFVKYPVNHHYAQILERVVMIMAASRGRWMAEAGLFNGDEPTSPGDMPAFSRVGDSWSARATVLPFAGGELQASYARVASPEFENGQGLDQRKLSASFRVERERDGITRYALVEWARTEELADGERAFRFGSVLAEAERRSPRLALGARLERTTRPESERLLDPFRTPLPHSDFNILGITRFSIVTASVGRPLPPRRGVTLLPFVEVAHIYAEEIVQPSAFVPRAFYGGDRLWNLSAGLRVRLNAGQGRMGRYGAALPATAHAH